jgi:NAD(P)-dependent dehydrogenase (short-subunit alcohol dehydrogenase family)
MPEKAVLITGAGGGIGRAAARLFAKDGWDVALADINAAALSATAAEVKACGRRFASAVCDTSDFGQVLASAAEIQIRLERIDVLVNNAGVSQPKPIVELEESEWDRTLAVNLKSAFNWTKILLPGMLHRQHGKIINISSISAKQGGGSGTVSKACYAASKAGLLGFTRGLAREVAPHVQVNAICPGVIATPMTEGLLARARDDLLARIPLGRVGIPEDVASMILFLASPAADYLTGEIIDVNGGMYID